MIGLNRNYIFLLAVLSARFLPAHAVVASRKSDFESPVLGSPYFRSSPTNTEIPGWTRASSGDRLLAANWTTNGKRLTSDRRATRGNH